MGGGVIALDAHHVAEREAFEGLRPRLAVLDDPGLADRLERLREKGDLWVAPRLGPERWAVFVEALSLVRRIYLRREALIDPVAHLYRTPRPDIPRSYQEAHAWIGLLGALRHELAHYDGMSREDQAYDVELAWYEARRGSPMIKGLAEEERRAWEWGLESAILSARKAREAAGAGLSAPPPP